MRWMYCQWYCQLLMS